ncbi:GPI ethanolamine phosphate transferase 2 [Colletotrichum spinosum]|uniref:GPI ethanolamine phosphate transferase 2 n=1 Tax=Colletotrichum spinosum TaxID=1347390 RepID=A0A4R8PNU1_9PEZI|nr:GPI ethanolamine phosphate transferase 2 [Colletotrichum spinosum]
MSFRYGPRFLAAHLTIANLLIPLAIVAFATGFFPYKPVLPGLAQYENLQYGPPPAAPFDRIIFMVVDALRSDFVYLEDSGFTYTQELIRDGAAVPFTASAQSPTVTMPRIKAITTGSIPSFLDVILNLDEGDKSSTLAAQDTWLAQMKAKQSGKLVMYGDDTWLKLFPETFDRADGTSSFFVSVGIRRQLRKAKPDLSRTSQSPHMTPKQREMDDIVKRVFHAMERNDHMESTLMILCGDHGMNDAGNHGASSPGETSPALVFISPKLRRLQRRTESPSPYKENFDYYSKVEQSDLAPTLENDQIQLLIRNARQILNIVTATFGPDIFNLTSSAAARSFCADPRDDAQKLACHWHRINDGLKAMDGDTELNIAWLEDMSEWLRKAQDLMSTMASNYDMGRLHLGEAVMGLVAGSLLMRAPQSPLPLVGICFTYGIMMFASSYVEEEQHFWYWSTSAWFGWLAVKRMQNNRAPMQSLSHFIVALAANRIIRGWNQTGQKHAGEPDIVKAFIITNPPLLWSLVSATYIYLFAQITRRLSGLHLAASSIVSGFLVLAAFTFKIAFTVEDAPELVTGTPAAINGLLKDISLVARARVVFFGLSAIAIFCTYLSFTKSSGKRNTGYLLHHLITLLAATQSRATNIPLLLLFTIQYNVLAALDLSLPALSISSLLLQYMSFFAFGGTNAISSVDLSSAYNGVAGFNVLAVGILTFVSNWAGPIYWTSATNLLLLRYRETHGGREVLLRHIGHLTLFTACGVLFVMVACEVLRTHLFVWTVFSPKYLYCMAWGIGQHLGVNVAFASLLYTLGSM